MSQRLEYRTIHEESSSALEFAMNEAAKYGWRVVSTCFVPGPYWNEYHATLERGDTGPHTFSDAVDQSFIKEVKGD